MNVLEKRGFLQISFAWLFGIIAGVVILTLAIYIATRAINTGQYQTSSEAQAQISTLFNPLETSFQSGQVTTLSLSSPTRIYAECESNSGSFGTQIISISQQSFGKWSKETLGASVQDRYIFSENPIEGKDFLIFSKPFEFPFKVADLLYITPASTEYCFAGTSYYPNINTELSNLNQKNIILEGNLDSCPKNSVTVCFTGNGNLCNNADIIVDNSLGVVEKNSTELSFDGDALMYAAIFSDKQTYDCQVKRLMERESQIATLYSDKINTIQKEGCGIEFASELYSLESKTSSFSNPETDLNGLIDLTTKLGQENEAAKCPLW